MMHQMKKAIKLFMMHESMGPVKITVMHKEHQRKSSEKVKPSMLFYFGIKCCVLRDDREMQHKEWNESKNGDSDNRIANFPCIIIYLGPFFLNLFVCNKGPKQNIEK